MAWDYRPPPPKEGVWEHWTYGKDVQGWSLRVGPMFYGDVRQVGETGPFYAMLNNSPLGNGRDPEMLRRLVDAEIVQRVRVMTSPYRAVLDRVRRGEVTPDTAAANGTDQQAGARRRAGASAPE